MLFEVGYKGTMGCKEYNIAWNLTKTSEHIHISSVYEYLIARPYCA
jgi:hypothetical protein